MNPVLDVMRNRRSVRTYEPREVPKEAKDEIIEAALRAPTAGGLMLYSIIEVTDQKIKDTLAKSCDNQPFIARAPWVLLFVADCQRWYDYFDLCGVGERCEKSQTAIRKPDEGHLFLACCDAIIAAHTAVIAAESLGIGSCYIGDITEKYEVHKQLFDLPKYAFPICLLCLGYPTKEQKERALAHRFQKKFVMFENQYKRLDAARFEEMFRNFSEGFHLIRSEEGATNLGQFYYDNFFNAPFSKEMVRSVREILKEWRG